MGFEASSSSSDSDGPKAPTHPPLAASSSSHYAAQSVSISSSPPSSVGDTIEVKNGLMATNLEHFSLSLSASSSSLLSHYNVEETSESVSDSESQSDSCSDDDLEIQVVSSKPTDWTSRDRCPYYPPRPDGCTEPRSCRDCLNVKVADDYSCMVNQYGRCVQKNFSTYVKALDFQYQGPSNDGEPSEVQKVQFPAGKVSYCSVGDKQCKCCKETVFADVMKGRIDGSLTKFCYGEDGCVCIAVCEAPIWTSTIGQTVCNGTVVNVAYESQHANTYGGSTDEAGGHKSGLGNLLLGTVGGVAAAVVFVAAVMYIRKRRREASDESSSSNSTNTQTGGSNEDGSMPMAVPILSLFGWQAMRSELIEREQLVLAGVEDFSNVRTGYLQLLDVDASAPPPEEDESSAPVLLVPLAGASAPNFSPRGIAALASAPSAPPESPTFLEEQLL